MRFICNNTQCFNVDRITNFKVTATNIQGIENPAQAISINIVINDNTRNSSFLMIDFISIFQAPTISLI